MSNHASLTSSGVSDFMVFVQRTLGNLVRDGFRLCSSDTENPVLSPTGCKSDLFDYCNCDVLSLEKSYVTRASL